MRDVQNIADVLVNPEGALERPRNRPQAAVVAAARPAVPTSRLRMPKRLNSGPERLRTAIAPRPERSAPSPPRLEQQRQQERHRVEPDPAEPAGHRADPKGPDAQQPKVDDRILAPPRIPGVEAQHRHGGR